MKRLDPIPRCTKCGKSTEGEWRMQVGINLLCPDCIDKYLDKRDNK
jgi:hypothetical protein